jgi:prepilin-type N-terminal cleavage/methylation domain-containing protein
LIYITCNRFRLFYSYAMLMLNMTRSDESGFTLVELIMATVIFGLFIIGIVNLYITIEVTQRKSYHLEMATRAGEKQIESLRNAQYGNLTPGTTLNFNSSLPTELPEPRTGTVAISEPEIGLRRVDVTITYQDGSATKTIKQSSLIGIIGIGQ